MILTIFTSDRFADHLNPPGHPERLERAEVMQVVASEFRQRGGDVREPRAATEAELARVHDREYISLVSETAGRATALDADTFTSPDSYEVALLAAGAAIASVDHVLEAPGRRALAMVRPPGHHAERNRAMGFCLFNNIAIAAAHARARGLCASPSSTTTCITATGRSGRFTTTRRSCSSPRINIRITLAQARRQKPEQARAPGSRLTCRLMPGATDADYDVAFETVAFPVLRQFRPELILISAGFDALADDPLGGMRLSADQFARLTAALAAIADECCGGRVVRDH